MAVRTKTSVCSRLTAGMAGSSPADGMDVLFVLSCVGSGPLRWDYLSFSGVLSGVCVWKPQEWSGLGQNWTAAPQTSNGKEVINVLSHNEAPLNKDVWRDRCRDPRILNIDIRRRLAVSYTLPSYLTRGKRAAGTHWIKCWVGSRDGLYVLEKRKFSCSSRNSYSRSSVVWLIYPTT